MPELTHNEHNFILLLRAALANRVADAGEILPEFDFGGIMHLAYNHKLRHMILSAMPEELLPDGVDRRKELIRRVAVQVGTTAAFLDVLDAMEAEGFHPIVVKGIVCRTLYPHPELRPSSDEDLYIPGGEFEDCCRFLQSRGFEPDKTPFSDYGEVGWHGNNGLYLELHRALFQGDALEALEGFFALDVLPTERYITHHGRSVCSMDPHHHFLYLLLHAYKHFIHSGFGIRQVCDIGIWAQHYCGRIDWQRLSEQCNSVRIKKFVIALLGIAHYDLGIELSLPADWRCEAAFCAPMLHDILCGGIYGSADADRLRAGTMTLSAVTASKARRKATIRSSVFPSRALLEGSYPFIKRHPLLLPLAWLLRICSYAKRSLKGETHAGRSIAIGKERIAVLRFYGLLD